MSRRHAVLSRDAAGTWWVDDVGSFHGTYVNGRPLRARTPLGRGACVQVGDVLLTLRDTTGATPGRFEPAERFLRAAPAAGDDRLRLRHVVADAPARLVLLQGPGVGTVLRLDGGPVTLGGVAGSTLQLDEPGCEAVEVVVRPVARRGFELVRRAGPVRVYVSVQGYERRLLWNNDVVRLVHDDGRVLSEVRYREAGSKASACLPGTPLPVGTEVDALPPSWAHWLRSPSAASPEAEGPAVLRSASPTVVLDVAEVAAAVAGAQASRAVTAEALAETPVGRSEHVAPSEELAARPSERVEGRWSSARQARRAAWAVVAASLALVAAVGVWLGTREPAGRAPDAMVAAARPTFEAKGAAVAPAVKAIVEPVVEGPASPGAALATTERVPAGGAAGARRVAVMGAPKPEGPEIDLNANDDARLRARIETRIKTGHASASELFQLRKMCARRGDSACLGRLDSLARQRSELDL